MKSLLNVRRYADPPQENILLRDEYWARLEKDDDWDDEEVYEEDDIDEF